MLGYSIPKTIKSGFIFLIIAILLGSNIGVPYAVYIATAAGSNSGDTGFVTGRVTTENVTMGVGGAYVAIVSSSDTNVELYNTTSDAIGYYQFTNVSANNSYMIHVRSLIGEGYSNVFVVMPNYVVATSVIINTKPSSIAMTATKDHVIANGTDYTIITAHVTDASGYPVADGYSIEFSLWNNTDGLAQLGNAGSGLPLGTNVTYVATKDGNASVAFGWTTNPEANYTIFANLADNGSVFGVASVYSVPLTQHGTGTIAGRVMYGNTGMGLSNTLVTLCSPPDDQILYSMYTNDTGFFQMTGVNDTVNDRGYASFSYMLHAYNDTFGMGYSGCFGVMPGRTTTPNISIYPPPAAIVVNTGRNIVAADGNDSTTIDMYVTDFLGNPTNGYTIHVHLLNSTNGMGSVTDQFGDAYGSDLYLTVINGSATAKFGWMSIPGATNTIVVSSTDNESVNGWANVTSSVPTSEKTGSVTGRVTAQYTAIGIEGAHVAIVSTYNRFTELYNTTADANGYYQFANVSVNDSYMIYASSGQSKGFSASFNVTQDTVVSISVVLPAKPNSITMMATNSQVTADGANYTIVTAYVTNAQGNPAADGTGVFFYVVNDNEDHCQLGNAVTGQPYGINMTIIPTNGGIARVAFGWTTKPGVNYSITANIVNNSWIYGRINVYSIPPTQNVQYGSVTGRVTTQNTTVGIGGAYVAIVSAYNTSIQLYGTTADAYGYYQFTGVNSTLRTDGTLDDAYHGTRVQGNLRRRIFAYIRREPERYDHHLSGHIHQAREYTSHVCQRKYRSQ